MTNLTPSLRLAHVDGALGHCREHGSVPLASFESARNHLAAVVAEHQAALAELERLRAKQALLARRLQHAYRSGFDDRHYSALAALGLASLNRESLAQQHATKVLAEIAEANAAPQQPERDGGGS